MSAPAERNRPLTVGVALPVPLDRLYHYSVPEGQEDAARLGCRVKVHLRNRALVGVIASIGDAPAGLRSLRPLTAILDQTPAANACLLSLTRWMADYYVCGWGEALRAALPSEKPEHRKPKRVRVLQPAPAFSTPAALKDALQQLRGTKQQALLRTCLSFIETSRPFPPKAELVAEAGAGSSTVRTLLDRGILLETEVEVLRVPQYGEVSKERSRPPTLTTAQSRARLAICSMVEKERYATYLLHGVTGSGKTEVYLAALEATLEKGKTGIVLVPEISLTPQTVQRFRARFGDQVAVLHSRMSYGERFDSWRLLHSGTCSIVIGPRSAVLAPLDNVGLIVVDEEHESSYKQHSPAPRYHARDVAVVRAKAAGAVCVLGTATPSMESLYNARIGKYVQLSMRTRVPVPGMDAAALPDIQILDLRSERRQGSLSQPLQKAIAQRLERREQIILLQNRRGFAPIWECLDCGWLPECTDCSVKLAYHKATRLLRCHYCGYSMRLPHACPRCAASDFAQLGTGTQRVQEDLREFFPGARILRMDLDTTGRKDAHYSILDRFGRGAADILVGTQMVAKGLDFRNVTLVGVISADVGLVLPDFRSEEQAFQLLMQVAGRAGRHALQGDVLIQTRRPDHPIFAHLVKHDYGGFAEVLLESRAQLDYPPYGRLVNVEVRGSDEARTALAASAWAHTAKSVLESPLRVLGPEAAFVARVKNQYRFHVTIRAPKRYRGLSDRLRAVQRAHGAVPRGCAVAISVDALGIF